MNTRTLTPQEAIERGRLAHALAAFEVWRNGRTSYRPEEVPAGLAVTNEDRSRFEILEFIAAPLSVSFAYVKDEPKWKDGHPSNDRRLLCVTTWTGDTLATITWQGDDYRGGFNSTRQNFRAVGINGRRYAGAYYKSSGSYCRIKEVKS